MFILNLFKDLIDDFLLILWVWNIVLIFRSLDEWVTAKFFSDFPLVLIVPHRNSSPEASDMRIALGEFSLTIFPDISGIVITNSLVLIAVSGGDIIAVGIDFEDWVGQFRGVLDQGERRQFQGCIAIGRNGFYGYSLGMCLVGGTERLIDEGWPGYIFMWFVGISSRGG